MTLLHRSQSGNQLRPRRATTFQQDLQNSDCIVIQGSNMAECHPVGFGWVMEAKRRGATIIHVDPRFTRTSAVADLHVPLRAGSDIAFLGGLIRYVLENDKWFREYVVTYTNAPMIVREDFRDTEDLDGLFSGFHADTRHYDPSSYDNTGGLGASTWRHVAFVEQVRPRDTERREPVDLGMPTMGPAPSVPQAATDDDREVRWLMSSDVCKHCTHAACLDVCPTGALFRTEFGTVVVQSDVCNGCGYCVPACPYGVIGIRPGDGRAWKCTLCYDRLGAGQEPACAKACPTTSIQFGPLDELRDRAAGRVDELRAQGVTEARLYGADPDDGVGGDGAFFLLLDEPEVYGLPPDPVVTTRDLPAIWRRAAVAAAGLAAAVAACVWGGRR